MPPKIIALAGVSGSGKTLSALYIAQRYGLRPYAFVDGIKARLKALHPELTARDLWGDGRDETKDFLGGRTVRQALWDLSTQIRKKLPGFTVAEFSTVFNAHPRTRGWVISDCRDETECDWCDRHAIVIKLLRNNSAVLQGAGDTHDRYVAKKIFQHRVNNTEMSKPELYDALDTVLAPYRLLR